MSGLTEANHDEAGAELRAPRLPEMAHCRDARLFEVSEKAGRHARLIELDPKYVDTIVLRWQEFSGGTATLGGRSSEEIAAGREAAAA